MKPLTFLAVEDDDVDMMSIRRAFKQLKIDNEIQRAIDGIEAFEILKSPKDNEDANHPDIVLLDLNMPRMNGLELLEELSTLEDKPNYEVFILTTSNSDQDIIRTHKYGVSGYILKEDLFEGLHEAFSQLDNHRLLLS